jgi:hypothetical protein
MKESQRLREQSARCIRLARDSTDPAVIDSLRAFALESEAQAKVQDLEEVASLIVS